MVYRLGMVQISYKPANGLKSFYDKFAKFPAMNIGTSLKSNICRIKSNRLPPPKERAFEKKNKIKG